MKQGLEIKTTYSTVRDNTNAKNQMCIYAPSLAEEQLAADGF